MFSSDGHATVGRGQLKGDLHEIHELNTKDYKPLIKALDASGVAMLQSLGDVPCPTND